MTEQIHFNRLEEARDENQRATQPSRLVSTHPTGLLPLKTRPIPNGRTIVTATRTVISTWRTGVARARYAPQDWPGHSTMPTRIGPPNTRPSMPAATPAPTQAARTRSARDLRYRSVQLR